MIKINLYDFDKTIYDGDSTVDFMMFLIKRHPICLIKVFRIGISVILKKLHIINKTKMKEQFYSMFKLIPDIDKDLKDFWNTHDKKIKKYYQDKDHSNDIVISASPEFLLEPICKKLKVKDMMASIVDKKTGKYDGINCHDTEKVRRLNEKYKNYTVMESYSDSIKSDYPILELAKKAYQVKGDELIPLDFKK